MGLSDPFQTTYEGSRQSLGEYGKAMESISSEYAKQKELEKSRQQQTMGALLGHFITEGYIKPTPGLMNSIKKLFPEMSGMETVTPAGVTPTPSGYQRTYKYGELGQVKGYEDKPIDTLKLEESERKKREETLKKAKLESDIQSKRIKTFRDIKGSWIQKGKGESIEKIASESITNEALDKAPFGVGNLPFVRFLAPKFAPKPTPDIIENYITQVTSIPRANKISSTEDFSNMTDEELKKIVEDNNVTE